MSPKELEQTIRSLLKESISDAELRERLEKLAEEEISFPVSPGFSDLNFIAEIAFFSAHLFSPASARI